MNQAFTPTVNIVPISNPDGTYRLNVSGYELAEIMKGLKYMERQRAASRKYNSKMTGREPQLATRHILSLNIINPQ